MYQLAVEFGEMDLSGLTYYGIIIIGLIFVISFIGASIPLANNIKKGNNKK
tara:strand:- start:680 stop:832 length:153 start_codon:yes stop_codon:yes gene_type:complete